MRQSSRRLKSNYSDWVTASLDHSGRYMPIGANGVFGLLGLVTAALGMLVLLTAGYLKHPVEPVVMFTNFVSSLGWGNNGSHEVFKVGLTLLTAMLLPYILFLVVTLRHHAEEHTRQEIHELTHHSASSWYVAAIGMWTLAWFVDIRVPNLNDALLILFIHTVGAALFFVFSIIGAIKLTKAMELHGISSKTQHLLVKSTTLSAVAMALSIAPLLIATHSAGLFNELMANGTQFLTTPEQRVSWLKTVTSNYPWISFFEWATAFSLLGWIGVTALQLFRQPVLVNINK